MIPPLLLLQAYRMGAFPMADAHGEILWFSPKERGIIPLETFHVPRGLRRRLRKNPFEMRINTAFGQVMRECARHDNTWINEEIIKSYVALHAIGHAHSVECWQEGKLVGGLYGVSIGAAFFGESMFHRTTDASKVALYELVTRLRERGYQLLDTQWTTPHLEQFGAYSIPKLEYMERLSKAVDRRCNFQ